MTTEKRDRSRCTKANPWDKVTIPVLHVDARAVGDTELMECPNCGFIWSMQELRGREMIKKLICWLWGHKTVVKAYTGKTYQTASCAGNPLSVSLYKWERTRFCLRCGDDVHRSDERR